MNGRKARALRKTAGGNEASYVEGTPPTFMNLALLPDAPVAMPDTFVQVAKGVPTRLRSGSTRSIYQRCKKYHREALAA